ncbi:MAG: glutamine-hydrolyzing GMP synthase [Candidatus Bipolaricaulota bacterium]|nr:glutamine-hydrolyzing GMP synthase [Candidatus Bipolaricaulota bacterium]
MSVVILDFGSQYTWLIARRIRELSTYSVILSGDASAAEIRKHKPRALILSGGPASVLQPGAMKPDPEIFNLELPILGICYGMQLLTQRFGGHVRGVEHREYGQAKLTRYRGALFAGISGEIDVWMSHSDAVGAPPPDWRTVAATQENPVAAIESPEGRFWGVQFHPEVVHTPKGKSILANFLEIAGVARNWTPQRTVDLAIREIKQRVKDEQVLLAVSGGVDSSTLALLLARAGVNHLAIFVDHGLLRLREREAVEKALRPLGVNLVTIDAKDRFLQALKGITDPEQKRKVIGGEFITLFEESAREYGPFRFLAQGTLYPDVIESAGHGGAVNIKSHHNVGGLPNKFGFELLEPLRCLFKDEVRELANQLGLPAAIRMRHPFPGPGLAIRILGEVTSDRLRVLRRADALFIDALREEGLYDEVWQALAVLTPVKSVGVVGDERNYGYVLALRAVTSIDGMTADWARLPADFLARVADRITRQLPEIGRVVYDITSKPPATIEWE